MSFALFAVSRGMLIAVTPTFQHDVLPIMQQRCIGCHGEQASGGLDLRTLEALMKGSSGGPAISPQFRGTKPLVLLPDVEAT